MKVHYFHAAAAAAVRLILPAVAQFSVICQHILLALTQVAVQTAAAADKVAVRRGELVRTVALMVPLALIAAQPYTVAAAAAVAVILRAETALTVVSLSGTNHANCFD
jgi:hypothetical protein